DLDAQQNRADKTRNDHGNDSLESITLHPPEDDEAIAGRFDLVVEGLEPVAEAERGDLALNQAFRGLRQRALCLADADCERTAFGLTCFDEELTEKMRFSRAASSIGPFVARWREQGLKHLRGRDLQSG